MTNVEPDFDNSTDIVAELGLQWAATDPTRMENLRRYGFAINKAVDHLIGLHKGRRANALDGRNIKNQAGKVVRVTRRREFIDETPQIVIGDVKTAVAPTDGTITLKNVRSMCPVETDWTAGELACENTYGWKAIVGAKAIAIRDQSDWKFRIIPFPWPPYNPAYPTGNTPMEQHFPWLTDLQLDDTLTSIGYNKLQLAYCTVDVTQATGGALAYISAKLCTKVDGSDYAGDTITVYFPTGHAGQPAVFTGDVISVSKDVDGLWYAIGDYGDDYIKSIKMWSGAVNTIPAHWAFCDGSYLGGLTLPDLRGRFIVCADFDTVSPAHTANHTDEKVGDKSDDSGVGGYDNIEVDWIRVSGVTPENPGSGCTLEYNTGLVVVAAGSGYRVGDRMTVDGTNYLVEVQSLSGSGVTNVTIISGSGTFTGTKTTTGANGVLVVSDVKNNPTMTGDTPDDKWTGGAPGYYTRKAVDNRPRYYALAYIMRWK